MCGHVRRSYYFEGLGLVLQHGSTVTPGVKNVTSRCMLQVDVIACLCLDTESRLVECVTSEHRLPGNNLRAMSSHCNL